MACSSLKKKYFCLPFSNLPFLDEYRIVRDIPWWITVIDISPTYNNVCEIHMSFILYDLCTYYTPGVYSDCHVRPSHLSLQDDKKKKFYAAFSNFNILLGRLFFCFKVSNFTVKLIKENCLKKNQLIKFVNELCSKLFLIRGNFCELVRAGKPT